MITLEDIYDYLLESIFSNPIRQSARFMAMNRGINLRASQQAFRSGAGNSNFKNAMSKATNKLATRNTLAASRAPGSIGDAASAFGGNPANRNINRMFGAGQTTSSDAVMRSAKRKEMRGNMFDAPSIAGIQSGLSRFKSRGGAVFGGRGSKDIDPFSRQK